MVDIYSEKLIGKRVGLDVDGVLSCFTCGVKKRAKEVFGYDFPTCQTVKYWDISDQFSEVMAEVWDTPEFWLNLTPLVPNIPYQPDCYITHRQVPSEITEEWLAKYNLPKAPVITVKETTNKLDVIRERNIDVFVDDYYKTIIHLRENGVNALLYHSNYQMGHREECKDLPTIRNLGQVIYYL